MRLAIQLGWALLAVVTIYWNGTPVLSLPPSLIANAASLRQNQRPMEDLPKDHRQNDNHNNNNNRQNGTESDVSAETPTSTLLYLAPADVAPNSLDLNAHQAENENGREPLSNLYLYESHDNDDDGDAYDDVNGNGDVDFTDMDTDQGQRNGRYKAEYEEGEEVELKRQLRPSSVYELNALLNMANRPNHNDDDTDLLLRAVSPRIRAVPSDGKSHTPLKLWPKQCRLNYNCLQEYYTALFSASPQPSTGKYASIQPVLSQEDDFFVDNTEDDERLATAATPSTNDIYMLMNGEQDVAKFLHWAMQQLYAVNKFKNLSESAAENYHPGMFLWKKLNSSGKLEPPLMVEEPHYIIVRREKLLPAKEDDDDPFIPPRGRKDDAPNLNALLQRYETFVPNRGRRDKISDIFKHDDLFYPNRGKKSQWNPLAERLASMRNARLALKGNAGYTSNDIDNEATAFAVMYKPNGHNQSVKMSLAQLARQAMSTPAQTRQQQQEHPADQPSALPLRQWQQMALPFNGQRQRRGGGWAAGARMAFSNSKLHSPKSMTASRGYQHGTQQKKQRYNQEKHFQLRRSVATFMAPIWRQLLAQQKLDHLALSPIEREHERHNNNNNNNINLLRHN